MIGWKEFFDNVMNWFRNRQFILPRRSLGNVLICLFVGLVSIELCGSYLAYRVSTPASTTAVAPQVHTAEQWRSVNAAPAKKDHRATAQGTLPGN